MKKVKTPITEKRWKEAQEKEIHHHLVESLDHSFHHYSIAYQKYFKYLGINSLDLEGKSIVEIGPAIIPSLLFCENYSKSYIIEPIEYPQTNHLYKDKLNISFIREPAEKCKFPEVDEVWIFNLMQHVQDPDLLIKVCKENSKIIRFFEPIDYPVSIDHPFSYSFEDYVDYFGSCVREYKPNELEGFHTSRCAYGIYECN